jgi:hypothetical protein
MDDPYYNEHLQVMHIGAKRAKKSRKIMAWTADRLAHPHNKARSIYENG